MSYQDFLVSQALMTARNEKALFRSQRQRQKARRCVGRKANGAKAARIEAARLEDTRAYED